MKCKLEQKEKTENEIHKQKLITEFTPFTGLRLWVPLQWVSIQLISLKCYKMVLESTSATVNRMLYKAFKTSSSGNYKMAFKRKRSHLITEYSRLLNTTESGHFTIKLSPPYWLKTLDYKAVGPFQFRFWCICPICKIPSTTE